MSGTQTTATVGTGNGTRRGRPPQMKAAGKRKRRSRAQIAAAAAVAQPTATAQVARPTMGDGTLIAMQQIDGILDKLTVAQLAAVDAWYRAKRPLAA